MYFHDGIPAVGHDTPGQVAENALFAGAMLARNPLVWLGGALVIWFLIKKG